MYYLRKSTASQEIPLGPFVDTSGVPVTTLTIANTDIKLYKSGGTTEVNKNVGGATHISNGRYYCVLDATDSDTVGVMRISVLMTGALVVWLDCLVLDGAVYDVLFGAVAPSTYSGANALSNVVWTNAKAGFLDNLNIGGPVASLSDIDNINQSAARRLILSTIAQYERPESGNSTYQIEARVYDGDGNLVDPDPTPPTLTATGLTTGNLSANLSVATHPSTGIYRWTYTVTSVATLEQVRFDLNATIDAVVNTLSTYALVCDFVAATFTTTDRSKIDAIFTVKPDNKPNVSVGGLIESNVLKWSGQDVMLSIINSVAYPYTASNVYAVQSSSQSAINLKDAFADTKIRDNSLNLATTIELNGVVYRFTTGALAQAPTGSGGGIVPTVDEIVDGILDELLASHNVSGSVARALAAAGAAGDPLLGEVEPGYTLRDVMKFIGAFVAGLTSGGGTDQIVFRDLNNTLDRLKYKLGFHNDRISVTVNKT